MFRKIKDSLKIIWPVTIRRFNGDIQKQDKEIRGIRADNKEILRNQKLILEAESELAKEIKAIKAKAIEGSRYAAEAVWAEIFNNTIAEREWGGQTSYSPGRWAVGYQYLYVMYRVLNEIKPKRILELGLGQSTRMLGKYAEANKEVEHTIVEHDREWIEFFSRDFKLADNSQIVCLDREFIPYKEAKSVRVFKNFEEFFKDKKYDFISIDAPLGGDMKEYARIDVLRLLPGILSDDFIIMIDDTERKGEQNTVNEMISCLRKYNIPFKKGVYSGKKDCTLICAEHLGFLTSM